MATPRIVVILVARRVSSTTPMPKLGPLAGGSAISSVVTSPAFVRWRRGVEVEAYRAGVPRDVAFFLDVIMRVGSLISRLRSIYVLRARRYGGYD